MTTTYELLPQKLKGKTVFIAGKLQRWRNSNLPGCVKQEGGRLATDVTAKLDILILGARGSVTARKQAEQLNAKQQANIQIISEADAFPLFALTLDDAVALLLGGKPGIARWNAVHQAWCYTYPKPAGFLPSFHGVDFRNADLTAACLWDVPFEQCDFRGAKLNILNFSGCQLTGAFLKKAAINRLVECQAAGVDFTKVEWENRWANQLDLHGTDFTKANLSGGRFHEGDLHEACFSHANLSATDAVGANASQANLVAADLTAADWSRATLVNADFRRANLRDANFAWADLRQARFDGADVTGANFVGAQGVDLSRAKNTRHAATQSRGQVGTAVAALFDAVKKTTLVTEATVDQAGEKIALKLFLYSYGTVHAYEYRRLRQGIGETVSAARTTPQAAFFSLAEKWPFATLDVASIGIHGKKAKQSGKELLSIAIKAWYEIFGLAPPSEQTLDQAMEYDQQQWLTVLRKGATGVRKWNKQGVKQAKQLADGKLSKIDLSKAKLEGINLRGLQLKSANLAGANLRESELGQSKWIDADLTGANLEKAVMRRISLTGAKLEGAKFVQAEMDSCSLRNAQCRGANFRKTLLASADLRGTDLTGANLTDAVLRHAKYDENTKFPDGFTPAEHKMVWTGKGTSPHAAIQAAQKPTQPLDLPTFLDRLANNTDIGKYAKAMKMLKADRFKLYAEVKDDHLVGVVKSQSDPDLVYSCKLASDGTYGCCTQNLNICGGLRGSICKHLLVLIVGLTRAGDLDPNKIDDWAHASQGQKPVLDKDAMSETFLKYKGAEAGEVDWRPTETIPEDYYAM